MGAHSNPNTGNRTGAGAARCVAAAAALAAHPPEEIFYDEF